jgi:YesN/AraC family two-component response regulator
MKNKNKILIVDDEVLIIDKVQKLLSFSFDNILTAENGKQALDIISKNNDLCCVITDIQMPIMDGIELVKSIRDNNNDIPIIIFTSHGDDQLMKQAVKYGVFDFIDKPLFLNLSESVSRGVEEGFKISKGTQSFDEDRIVSEYERLLLEISS